MSRQEEENSIVDWKSIMEKSPFFAGKPWLRRVPLNMPGGLPQGASLSRRDFVKSMGVCTLGAMCSGSIMGSLFSSPAFAADGKAESEVGTRVADKKYWRALADKKVECLLCPNHCSIAPAGIGFCRTRGNQDGVLYTKAYGNPFIIQPDPLEKLPMYHVTPGQKALITATGGCNLRCIYCQNWEQSQSEPDKLKQTFKAPPADIVKAAKNKQGDAKSQIGAVGFTYTDPAVFYEYAREIAVKAKEAGIKVIMGTAANLNPEPLKELIQYTDAWAVTLKGYSETFYKKVTGVAMKPILDALVQIKKSGKWLEVVNLIVPTLNDDMKEIREMCKWVKTNLGEDTPMHFERFVRAFKLKDLPDTPILTCEQARNIALEEGLKYVYLCNISPHDGNHTYCPKCKQNLVKRLGFTTLEVTVGKDGACSRCGAKIPGVWA